MEVQQKSPKKTVLFGVAFRMITYSKLNLKKTPLKDMHLAHSTFKWWFGIGIWESRESNKGSKIWSFEGVARLLFNLMEKNLVLAIYTSDILGIKFVTIPWGQTYDHDPLPESQISIEFWVNSVPFFVLLLGHHWDVAFVPTFSQQIWHGRQRRNRDISKPPKYQSKV